MAKQELFHSKLIGYIIGNLGAFPVHRGQFDRQSIRQAYQILADGQALVMFPEGTRSHSGQLQSALPGPALIAIRSSAPILPIGFIGTEKIKGVAWMLRRPRITVNIGRPFHLPPVSNKLAKTELIKLTNSIMEHLAELLPPEYHGDYAKQGD